MHTRVLDILEVYKLIPETKKLESKSFINLRNLLEELVKAIEVSGEWEFVNYISNNPSLIIIRKKEQSAPVNYRDYTTKNTSLLDIKSEVSKQTKISQETKDTPLNDNQPIKSQLSGIPKLPWEKE